LKIGKIWFELMWDLITEGTVFCFGLTACRPSDRWVVAAILFNRRERKGYAEFAECFPDSAHLKVTRGYHIYGSK